jgi:ubiquinol-cytochrome c reductase cytochrome c subunit
MLKRVLMVTVGVVVALLAVVGVLAHEGGGDEHGAQLYAENCLACHGPRGEARLDTQPAFAKEISYSLEFASLVAQGVEGTFMGPWGVNYGGPLTDEEVLDLMAYAETWAGGEVPPLPAPEVPEGLSNDATAGAELYLVNCQGCHGPAGEGRGLARYPAIDPHADVVTATRRGVGNFLMPPFADVNGGPLNEEEINQIMAYVRSWDRPTALQAAAENNPAIGAWQLVLLGGLAAVFFAGFLTIVRR